MTIQHSEGVSITGVCRIDHINTKIVVQRPVRDMMPTRAVANQNPCRESVIPTATVRSECRGPANLVPRRESVHLETEANAKPRVSVVE
jgi:hypothetical protein